MLLLLAESAIRSLFLGLLIYAVLKGLRVRDIKIHWNAWTGVLLAGLCMPLLMQWPALHRAAPQMPALNMHVLSLYSQSLLATGHATGLPASGYFGQQTQSSIGLLAALYSVVAGILLLRLVIGLILTLRLRRLSQPLVETWTGDLDVRVSPSIQVPVTIASTIILPFTYATWTSMQRQAVLSHEGSHARRGDFFVQIFAGIYRAIIWFSPFSWWLWEHLARLAEAASDDAAIMAVRDRSGYAEILLEFARSVQLPREGIAMARPAGIRERIERILDEKEISCRTNRQKQLLFAIALVPLIAMCAGFSWRSWTAQSAQNGSAASSATAVFGPSQEAQTTEPSLCARIDTDKGPYVIVDGESLAINGSGTKVIMGGNSITIDKIRSQRTHKSEQSKGSGDRIWFQQDGKTYTITDANTVEHAKSLFRRVEEIGRKQGELGSQQGRLGARQGKLGQQQGEYGRHPDEASAAEQTRIGEVQSALGEQQTKLGEEQSQLAEEETRTAEQAIKELRGILTDSLRNASAVPSD
jgi:hypothetical protein